MKQSQYNYIKSYEDGTMLIYNTLSSGVLRLNNEFANQFRECEENGFEGDSALINNLKQGHMILADDYDEKGSLNLRGKMSKFSSYSLTLTITPTLSCNFKCPYCYEKGLGTESMSQETQDKLIDFINTQADHIKALGIAWYGGEPLLEFDMVEHLSKRIINICNEKNVRYEASMVTNGYLLSEDYANRMKEIAINKIQVTLDGDAEQHDQRRICHDGSPTYSTIMDNIAATCDIIKTNIRINVDKNNFTSLTTLLDDLKRKELNRKVNIYIAPVDNVNDAYISDECMTVTQFSDLEINFYDKLVDGGFSEVRMPTAIMGYCGAVSINSFVIDPNGDLYKCWNEVGRIENSVGSLYSGLKSSFRNCKWLLYDAFNDNDCADCKMLPVCFGGCAHKALYTTSDKCKSTKYNLDKMLDLLVKTKSAKLSIN